MNFWARLKYIPAYTVYIGSATRTTKETVDLLSRFPIIVVIRYALSYGFCHAVAYVATLLASTSFRRYCSDFGWYGWIIGRYVGGYVLGRTWQPGADTIDPKHTPVGTCEINRKFNNDRRVSPPGTTSRYVSTQTYPVFAHRTGSK